MSGYTLTKRELTAARSRLTRVINAGDPRKIIGECKRASALFEEKGFPDCWSRWERAQDDAGFAIRNADDSL